MRILVTGGAGFQGSHVAEHCMRAGHTVTVLNTFSEEALRNTSSFARDVSLVWGTVTDREIVDKTVRGQDVVMHMAARINVDESLAEPESYLHVNVLGTFNVLEAVRKRGCRLVYASSCEVYGQGVGSANEASELRPHSPYAASKAAADRLCFAYWKSYGINVAIIRACNIYGPRQRSGKYGAVIPKFVERALRREPLVVFGTGEQRREYMHVNDLVAVYGLVLERCVAGGEVINFGSGETPSIKEIAEFIGRRLGAMVEYGAQRPGEVRQFLLDSGRAKGLGFTPTVAFWEGLDDYINWQRLSKAAR